METAFLILGMLFAVAITVCVSLFLSIRKLKNYTKVLETSIQTLQIKSETKVNTSRSVLRGKLVEQLYPMLHQSEHDPHDFRFMGDFADYIIVKNYTRVKDGEDLPIEIIFTEIKTGKSRLSRHQNYVKKAVEAGRVSWRTITIEE